MPDPLGWDLPAGAASDPRAPWNAPEHAEGCPEHPDAPERCDCGCQEPNHEFGQCLTRLKSGKRCACDHFDPVPRACECAEIAENAEASRQDAAEARREERDQ